MLLFHGLGCLLVMNISTSSSSLTCEAVKSPNQAIRHHQNIRDASGICVLLLALSRGKRISKECNNMFVMHFSRNKQSKKEKDEGERQGEPCCVSSGRLHWL